MVRSTVGPGGLVEIGLTPKRGAVDGQGMRAHCLVVAECGGAVRAHVKRALVQRAAVPSKPKNVRERCGAMHAGKSSGCPWKAPVGVLACRYGGRPWWQGSAALPRELKFGIETKPNRQKLCG